MNLTIEGHVPTCYATDTNREFNPETECHYAIFTVKVVDPGCTLEVQVEERSGAVTRITTTEDPEVDHTEIRKAVNGALDRLFAEFGI